MTFKISFSLLFREQIEQVKEMGEPNDYKRVLQNMKQVVKDLERLEKSGMTLHDMAMKNNVSNTNYVVSYKVKTNPKKKLIVKRIYKHR